MQRRIQDFPDREGGGTNLLLGEIFPENSTKIKEIGPKKLASLRSTNAYIFIFPQFLFKKLQIRLDLLTS